jgi:hypothetical protein
MKLIEAFKHQLETTRLLTQEDLADDTGDPVVWNGLVLRPEGNFYSSGKTMKPGDKLIVGYVISNTRYPAVIMIEENELEEYEKIFQAVRVVDNIPMLEAIDKKDDQYKSNQGTTFLS